MIQENNISFRKPPLLGPHLSLPENHLSNTTCLTQVVFKSDEYFNKLWWSLTRRNTHKTNEAALDRQRQTSSAAQIKRGLEYGVQTPVFYGNLWDKTVFHEYLQEACFVLTEISNNIQKVTGKCNLGILYSSSLLRLAQHSMIV